MLENALTVATKRRDLAGEALILGRTGYYLEQVGQAEKSIQLCQKSLLIYSTLNDLHGEAAALNSLGLALDDQGDFNKAIGLFERARKIERNLHDKVGEAISLDWMGLSLSDRGDKAKGLDSCQRSLMLLDVLNAPLQKASALIDAGKICLELGDQKKALDYLNRALKVSLRSRDIYASSLSLSEIGYVYATTGRLADAIYHFRRSLALYEEQNNRLYMASMTTNIGAIFYRLGQVKPALKYFERALPIYVDLGDKQSEVVCLRNIAGIESDQGDSMKAVATFKKALDLVHAYGERESEAATLTDIGINYATSGKPEEALKYLQSAVQLAKKIGDRPDEARALSGMGRAYRSLNQTALSLEFYNRALVVLRQVQDVKGEAETMSSLSALTASSNPSGAIWFGKQAVNLYQEIRKNIASLDKKTRRIYKESVAKAYRRLADQLAEQGRIGEAEQVLRLLKDDELYEYLRSSDLSTGAKRVEYTPAESAVDKEYETLTQRLADEARQVADLQKTAKPGDKQLKDLLAKLEEGEALFQTFLERTVEKSKALQVPETRVARIEDAQSISGTLALLPEGTVAVYVLATPDALRLLYFAAGTSVGRVSIIKEADLNRKVLAFRQALIDPASDPRPLGKEFYDLLVKPIEPLLAGSKATRIMWSLDGQLRYIPLAALYDGSSFLIEKFDLSCFTPAGGSAPLERDAKKSWRALAVGVSRAHDIKDDQGVVQHFPALAGVPSELDGVVRALPNSTKLLDEAFTLASFKEGLSSHPNLVHLATHFSFNPGDEAHSYLVTGDGKPFRVADARTLSTLSLQGVSLLTLSACETALGGSDGSEVEGISAILQKKGAEAVVATLWPVADSSTAALMSEFYLLRQANPNWSKLHALQSAQLGLMRGSLSVKVGPTRSAAASPKKPSALQWPKSLPRYSHPYYWAPFVLMGNWK